MLVIPSRIIATCFALTSFAGAILVGIWVGNEPVEVLKRAVLVMVVCWLIGLVLGAVAQRTVDDYLEAYRQAHPILTDEELMTPTPQEAVEGESQAEATPQEEAEPQPVAPAAEAPMPQAA